jgi:hypothetical protein
MGASHGKTKKELKEEAREWAITKENEVAELYAQNTELRNHILMMQEDMRALRDMLKGQQSALNESVKQVNERMTEMENDVKVVPFCGGYGGHPMPLSSISTTSEQEIYYRNHLSGDGHTTKRLWDDEKKIKEYTTSFMRFGRVYSLKQFEKVYVDEWKFKKISHAQFSQKMYNPISLHGGYVHGLPKGEMTLLFPSHTYVTGNANEFFKCVQVEPDEE